MTRRAKLYRRLLDNPAASISFREFETLLSAFGFVVARTVGSHRQYTHPQVPRPLPVQPTGKDAKPYQVRQFLDMIHAYNLSMNE